MQGIDCTAGRRPRSCAEHDKGCLVYTLDPESSDEDVGERKDPFSPIEVLMHHLRKKYSPHALIGKWALRSQWEAITKSPKETGENFFLRYAEAKNRCELHGVDLGPQEDRARHLFGALGLSLSEVARVLEQHDYEYPKTAEELQLVTDKLQ